MKLGLEKRRDDLDRAPRLLVSKFVPAVLTLMLVACATSIHVDSIERAEIGRTAATKPVVLGQLHMRSTGGIVIMPDQPERSNKTWTAGMLLVRLSDANAYFADVYDDGRFAWGLDPGTYVIERVTGLSRRLRFNYGFCPKSAFRVERPAGIVNLGEIMIVFPSDPTERFTTPGFLGDVCKDPENQISVTQRAGELTKLVQHPLTPVVVAPQLPELWEARSVNQRKIPEARAVLQRLGFIDSD